MASDSGYISEQIQKLEELFVECKFPNRLERQKRSTDLGLSPDQIKCWFDNKMLLLGIEEKQQEDEALKRENARIQLENVLMMKKLENWPTRCVCSRKEAVEDLLLENAKLREEHERVTKVVVGILQNPMLLQLQGHQTRCPDDEEIQNLELGLAPASSSTSSNESNG